jgi:hypothetical protein
MQPSISTVKTLLHCTNRSSTPEKLVERIRYLLRSHLIESNVHQRQLLNSFISSYRLLGPNGTTLDYLFNKI